MVKVESNAASVEMDGFFQQGRDYESRYVNHKYLRHEQELLKKYESLDYFSPHSTVYKVSSECIVINRREMAKSKYTLELDLDTLHRLEILR